MKGEFKRRKNLLPIFIRLWQKQKQAQPRRDYPRKEKC